MSSDIVKNTVKNVIFPFYVKGNDFKDLSIKVREIKDWLSESGSELAEFIYLHRNQYNATVYKYLHLKDIPSTLSKVDIVFK